MRDLLDLLFCPIHGIFRPDNLVMACTVAGNELLAIKGWLVKIVLDIRRKIC